MTDTTRAEREALIERLRERRVTRWVHATGQTPQASGYKPDPECTEAADTIRALLAELDEARADAQRWMDSAGAWAQEVKTEQRLSFRTQVAKLEAELAEAEKRHMDALRVAVADAVMVERERCAHVCKGIAAGYAGQARRLKGEYATHAAGQRDGANECAAAIRDARSDKETP